MHRVRIYDRSIVSLPIVGPRHLAPNCSPDEKGCFINSPVQVALWPFPDNVNGDHHGNPVPVDDGRYDAFAPWLSVNVWPQELHLVHNARVVTIPCWPGQHNTDETQALLVPSLEGIWLARVSNSNGGGAKPRWESHRLVDAGKKTSSWPFHGHSEAILAHSHGRHFIISVRPWHDGQVVAYPMQIQSGAGACTWHVADDGGVVIDEVGPGGHDLLVLDLDHSGNQAIFVGFRGGHGSRQAGVAQYSFDGRQWQRDGWIHNGSVSAIVSGDFDHDGHVDLAISAWGKTGDTRITVLYGGNKQ
jgi:hypothetical protein